MAKKGKKSKKKKDKPARKPFKAKKDSSKKLKKKSKSKKGKSKKQISSPVAEVLEPEKAIVAEAVKIDPEPYKETVPDTQAVYETFNRLVNLFNEMANAPVTHEGYTIRSAELSALEQIQEDEPVSMATLAGHLGISKSAALKTVNKLAFKGLINKDIQTEPVRMALLTLTDQGRELIQEKPSWSKRKKSKISSALAKMSDQELACFNAALERILMNFD